VTARLLVVCEAAADFRTASELADRVLCADISWLDEGLLASVRQWLAVAPDLPFVRWDKLDSVAQEYGLRRLRPRSRFGGEPVRPTPPLRTRPCNSRPSSPVSEASPACS